MVSTYICRAMPPSGTPSCALVRAGDSECGRENQGRQQSARRAVHPSAVLFENVWFALVTVATARLGLDFYDVLNTREKASEIMFPTPDEVVLSYSWCGTREEV